MRPVNRPACPITSPSRYQAYLLPLSQSFGAYCSYCERPDKLDVEHVVPTSKQPSLELEWTNLLLGCPRCNRDFKKSRNDDRVGYLWPDTHDTFSAFEYLPDGRVRSTPSATQAEADALADLVKLEDSAYQATLNLERRRAFRMAERMLVRYRNGDADLFEVVDVAGAAFWSVWMTVFRNESPVVAALIDPQNFPGTATQYF